MFVSEQELSKKVWWKLKETIFKYIPENKDFYSQLNIEDITEADYVHLTNFV